MQKHRRKAETFCLHGLAFCLSKEGNSCSFALKFHKSQAARQKRGGTGEGGESNLIVFHFHKHTGPQGIGNSMQGQVSGPEPPRGQCHMYVSQNAYM